ncbi:hypothetical protein B0H12DRAFT_1238368 [Mycena haematopus]|nr:hypothetical protein B0H12DRAFT_1238368 [Mycena haematopus]
MSGFLYLPPFVFRASTLRCPSSPASMGVCPLTSLGSAFWRPPFGIHQLRLPSSLWLPIPSSSRLVVPNLLLTIFPSCTLTPSVLIPVSEPSPFLPDFVLPPARDITSLEVIFNASLHFPPFSEALPLPPLPGFPTSAPINLRTSVAFSHATSGVVSAIQQLLSGTPGKLVVSISAHMDLAYPQLRSTYPPVSHGILPWRHQ